MENQKSVKKGKLFQNKKESIKESSNLKDASLSQSNYQNADKIQVQAQKKKYNSSDQNVYMDEVPIKEKFFLGNSQKPVSGLKKSLSELKFLQNSSLQQKNKNVQKNVTSQAEESGASEIIFDNSFKLRTKIDVEQQIEKLEPFTENLAVDQDLVQIINRHLQQYQSPYQDHKIFFAEKIQKFNKFKIKQERILLITNQFIFNIKQQKIIRRQVEIINLNGITINRNNNQEILLHIKMEADLRLKIQKRKELIDILKILYLKRSKNQNLPIYGVKEKSLYIYEKNDNDLKKGIEEKVPEDKHRLEEEDLLKMNLDDATCEFSDDEEQDEYEVVKKQLLTQEDVQDIEEQASVFQNRKKYMFSYHSSDKDIDQEEIKLSSSIIFDQQNINDKIGIKNSQKLVVSQIKEADLDEQKIIGDFDKKSQEKDGSGKFSNTSEQSVKLEDFKILKFISKGSFGSVFLAYLSQQDKYFAIKTIQKDEIIQQDLIEKVKLEKQIMLDVDHPFIVKMHFLFQKSYRIYFVMDYISGGELFKHLQQVKRFNENQVKFLSIQIILALGYLHKTLNVIYRDLKPENIILDEHGYIKLTDFGLSKQADQSDTFCGTPEYISPEMLQKSGHDKNIDWWALGILIYELLAGIPPFYNKDMKIMFQNIQNAEIIWPDPKKNGFTISKDAQDLITQLLQRNKELRLGAKNDSDEILAHKFFKGIEINKVVKRKFKAPYIPKKNDLQNIIIDPQFQKMMLEQNEEQIPEQIKLLINQKREVFRSFEKQNDLRKQMKQKSQ